MSVDSICKTLVAAVFLLAATSTAAQQNPAPYGAPIGTEAAKKIVAAALAEARKNNWRMAASKSSLRKPLRSLSFAKLAGP